MWAIRHALDVKSLILEMSFIQGRQEHGLENYKRTASRVLGRLRKKEELPIESDLDGKRQMINLRLNTE
jgi:hypothetical protein